MAGATAAAPRPTVGMGGRGAGGKGTQLPATALLSRWGPPGCPGSGERQWPFSAVVLIKFNFKRPSVGQGMAPLL